MKNKFIYALCIAGSVSLFSCGDNAEKNQNTTTGGMGTTSADHPTTGPSMGADTVRPDTSSSKPGTTTAGTSGQTTGRTTY